MLPSLPLTGLSARCIACAASCRITASLQGVSAEYCRRYCAWILTELPYSLCAPPRTELALLGGEEQPGKPPERARRKPVRINWTVQYSKTRLELRC